jgi:hypothetical protein
MIGNYFEESGTNSGFAVKNYAGSIVGTADYTASYTARKIVFGADTAGSAYYLDIRAYDARRTAASVWRAKAGMYAAQIDWQSDNHRVSASQAHTHAMQMAIEFERQAGPQASRFFRVDEAWG